MWRQIKYTFVNCVPIDLKIGTYEYIPLYSIGRFSITCFISANNEDIGQKFLPDTYYDHTLML